MNTGYGHALLVGDASMLLQSFVEFTKDPNQQLEVTTMTLPYVPIPPKSKAAAKDLGEAFSPMISNHADELFDGV